MSSDNPSAAAHECDRCGKLLQPLIPLTGREKRCLLCGHPLRALESECATPLGDDSRTHMARSPDSRETLPETDAPRSTDAEPATAMEARADALGENPSIAPTPSAGRSATSEEAALGPASSVTPPRVSPPPSMLEMLRSFAQPPQGNRPLASEKPLDVSPPRMSPERALREEQRHRSREAPLPSPAAPATLQGGSADSSEGALSVDEYQLAEDHTSSRSPAHRVPPDAPSADAMDRATAPHDDAPLAGTAAEASDAGRAVIHGETSRAAAEACAAESPSSADSKKRTQFHALLRREPSEEDPTAPADFPDVALPDPLPMRWPMILGVFGFPFRREIVLIWLAFVFSAALVVMLAVPAVRYLGLAAGFSLTADGIPSFFLGCAAVVLGLWWLCIFAAEATAIVTDTAEGSQRVEHWPDPFAVSDWMGDALYLLIPSLACAIPTLAFGPQLAQISPEAWLLGPILGAVLFPVAMLSTLANQTPFVPLSFAVLGSMIWQAHYWLAFYVEVIVLGVISTALIYLTIAAGPPLWVAVGVSCLVCVTAAMIYFRLLGRLAWCCSDRFSDALASEQELGAAHAGAASGALLAN